jgi:heat shock protein HslJ
MNYWTAFITVALAAPVSFQAMSVTPTGGEMESVIYWVNSYRVPCTGVGPMACLQIRREEFGPWELFYSEIEGFEYMPGYLYRIRVREEPLDPAQVPADASSIRHLLVAVEEKKMDRKLRINDIWILRELEGNELRTTGIPAGNKRPYVEFHVRDQRYMGNDGCNSFRGNLEALGERELRLGPATGTRMSCSDMALPDAFLRLLARVDGYEIVERGLRLLEGGSELLRFSKTD